MSDNDSAPATRGDINGVRGEISELRTELRGEISELRTELRGEINGVRGEINGVRGEINGVRGEVKELRADLHGEINELRTEVRSGLERVETNLLTAFHQWAQTYEIRARGTTSAVHEFDQRLGLIDERLSRLERERRQ
jgi:chromosome segregation ATPase